MTRNHRNSPRRKMPTARMMAPMVPRITMRRQSTRIWKITTKTSTKELTFETMTMLMTRMKMKQWTWEMT